MSDKKGFFAKAFEDMKENAKVRHEIDKENFNAIKADSKARFESAKETNPDFQEFKDADGIIEKAKVVMSHMERNAKEIAEEEKENYKEMLEKQRKQMNKNITE